MIRTYSLYKYSVDRNYKNGKVVVSIVQQDRLTNNPVVDILLERRSARISLPRLSRPNHRPTASHTLRHSTACIFREIIDNTLRSIYFFAGKYMVEYCFKHFLKSDAIGWKIPNPAVKNQK